MKLLTFIAVLSGMLVLDMPYKDPEKRREYQRLQMQRRRAANPEKAREQARLDAARFRAKNPERVLETNRAWYAKNKEHAREKQKARATKWLQRDPDGLNRAGRKWNKEHPEKRRALSDAWRRKNLARVANYQSAVRAKRQKARGKCSFELAEQRVQFFGDRCAYCRGPYEHLDHAIALARGGTNWPANFRPACSSCNQKKQAQDWRRWPVHV